jgi:hypothetical protein
MWRSTRPPGPRTLSLAHRRDGGRRAALASYQPNGTAMSEGIYLPVGERRRAGGGGGGGGVTCGKLRLLAMA